LKEQGKVIRIVKEDIAEVSFSPKSACAKCGLCHRASGGEMVILALNEIGAKIGEGVEVEIPEVQFIKSSFLIFIFPIISLIVFYLIGFVISGDQGVGALSSILGLILAAFLLKMYDLYIVKGKPIARIINKIE